MNKKAILLFFVVSIFGICCLSAQQQKMFYYYKGDSISLNVNSQHFLVYADANKISKELFEKEYRVTEWIKDGNNGILEAQVNIPNDNYSSAVYALKAKEHIIDVEPVIGNTVLYNTSRLFYIKLHASQDYSLLSFMASRTGAEIKGEVSFCENWYELSVNKNSTGNSIETANQFWESQYFADIDPGFIFHFEPTSGTECVSDTRFDEQWGMQAIKACSAWKITKGDTNVRIAVIDMGIDVRHQEFDSTHVVFSYDIETNTPIAKSYFTEDWPRDNNPNDSATRHYHGMHVGGIIFANHNRYEVAGCCPNSSLVNISTKFIDDDSIASKMANSINLAVLQGAKVINNSWGDAGGLINRLHSPLVENAIDYAIDQNRIVVFSAGNEGDSVNYPARYRPDILTVGAIDSNLFVASFSNIGPELDVVAPGVSILSTYNPNTYHSTKGTSMAAPHVSGVMGLLFSINPNLTTAEAREIVELTAQKIGIEPSINDSIHNNGLWDYFVGYGLLDAHRAVLKAAFHKVYGDTALTLCDTNCHAYTVRAPHNANIDSVSFFWSCSDNLQTVAGQNTDSVWVKRIHGGTGQLQCHIVHDGDTVTSSIEIPVLSNRPVYDNVSLSGGFSFPDTFVLSREIVIDSLAGLYWQNKTVLCTPDCRIIVRPGGFMTLDHTTLTSACANRMWQGIEVTGNSGQPQILHNQGTLHVENGSVIENAFTAVRNCLATDNAYVTTGGIVQAYSSTFRNNCRAVEFDSYGYSTQPGLMPDYTSTFNQCTFTVNDQNLFAANAAVFAEHVKLWDVKGIRFNGCGFYDSTDSPVSGRRGLYAEDAGLVVETYCDYAYSGCECPESHATHSSFTGFTTAVEVNTTGEQYPVTVDGARFENNITGVRINGNNYTTVTRCDFDLSQSPTTASRLTGLRLNNSTGFKVEGNTFTCEPDAPAKNRSGVIVAKSGKIRNTVYRNLFERLTYGVSASDTNGSSRSGLTFSCNVFNSCNYCFYVTPGALVAPVHGSLSQGVDNYFSHVGISSLRNLGGSQLTYYHSSNGVFNLVSPTGVLAESNLAASNPCASTLCGNNGGGGSSYLAGFQSGMNTYTTALAENANADGTGKDETLAGMRQSLSETYYEAVRALMSDTVLDLDELEQWHAAAQPIADPYSLTETRFMMGYDEPFLAGAGDAELANYAEFHVMKLALRNQNDNLDNQDNDNSSNLPNDYSPSINWYALTPAQIAQLQTIAERNTGRASVMAKGVLCFFFGICYDDDLLADDNADNADNQNGTRRAESPRPAGETYLNVYPNPTDDLLYVELSGAGIAAVVLYDLQGRMVYSQTPDDLPAATVNMRNIPAGIYLLRVTDSNGKEYQQKIVRK